MNSIERRFKKIVRRHYGLSTYMCFAEAIAGQYFQRRTILFWFNKLVDKRDYIKGDKKQIVDFLDHISNYPEERTKSA